MPNIRWKFVGVLLLAACLAYLGVYLLGPDHVIESYVRWGYPLWAHFAAGALFLTAALLLPFRRTRWPGALIACSVLAVAATTCALNGDYAHAVQGPPLIAVIVWLALDRRAPASL